MLRKSSRNCLKTKSFCTLICSFALFFFLSGCGYRWQGDLLEGGRPTLAVPYVAGDSDGTFTAELVRAITASGIAHVAASGADFRLAVSLGGGQVETVGYRFDRQKVSGELKKNIVGCEGRKTVAATATLYRGSTEEIAYGPCEVAADADYDYIDGDSLRDLVFINSDGMSTTALSFSLGQLEPVDAAQEAAGRPLNARLARKIVDSMIAAFATIDSQSTPSP